MLGHLRHMATRARQVLLTSTAYYDGTQRHASGQKNLEYNGYGSAASEVEVRLREVARLLKCGQPEP